MHKRSNLINVPLSLRDEPSMTEMHCLLYLDETVLLVGCNTNKIISVDLTRPEVTAEVGAVRLNQ